MNAIGPTIRYANRDDWAAFLAPLNVAVRNSPDRQTFVAFCGACADALAVRVEWLTPIRRRDAMARFAFWPSVADVGAIFDADKAHAMAMAGFRDSAGRLPPPEPPRPPTDAEREANRAKVAALKAELAATITKDSPKASPAYLTTSQLRAAYEHLAAQGSPFAKARLETLR
jgi:hypothetical protein